MMEPIPNSPGLWHAQLRWPGAQDHKYTRGHALVLGGDEASTGAAKLTARAALRAGAGLVSILCTKAALPCYATSLTAIMTKLAESREAFRELVNDARITALALGPGAGVNERTERCVLETLKTHKHTVLDADALTCFAGNSDKLCDATHAKMVLTPHEGEYTRLFGDIKDRTNAALNTAQRSGAVVVLKGSQTLIASPDRRCVKQMQASPFLATAGSGDVLTGIITGLLAQGMEAFDAACAAVWIHAQAAEGLGAGMIAEDITEAMPAVLQRLYAAH